MQLATCDRPVKCETCRMSNFDRLAETPSLYTVRALADRSGGSLATGLARQRGSLAVRLFSPLLRAGENSISAARSHHLGTCMITRSPTLISCTESVTS